MGDVLRFPKQDGFPTRTNMFEPCELFMEREHLILMLESNLQAIERNRETVDMTEEMRRTTEEAVQQREELLAWANAQEADMLYVALYPTSEDECEEPGMDEEI